MLNSFTLTDDNDAEEPLTHEVSVPGLEDDSVLSIAEVYDRVPRCFISKTMEILANRFQKKSESPIPLGVTAGQAIPFCLISTILLWTVLPCFCYLANRTTQRLDNGEVRYAWWTWLVFVSVLISCATIELICFRFVIVPKIQVLKSFSIGPFNGVPFMVWFVFTWSQSLMFYISFAAQGLFYGTMLTECDRNFALNEIWNALISQSVWGYLPHSLLPALPTMALLVLGAQYLRLFWTLGMCFPIFPDIFNVDYEVCTMDDEDRVIDSKRNNYVTRYQTCFEAEQNHGAALMSLASLNGLNLVIFSDLQYAHSKAEIAFKSKTGEYWENADKHVMTQLQRGVSSALFRDAVANGFLMNLQISVVIMNASLDGTTPISHPQEMLAICVTLLTSGYRLSDSFRIAFKSFPWYSRLKKEGGADAETKLRGLFRWMCGMGVALFVNILVWAYAILKLSMGFYCPHAIWNVTGCAELPAVM